MLQDLLLILKIIKRTYIAHKKRKVSSDKAVRHTMKSICGIIFLMLSSTTFASECKVDEAKFANQVKLVEQGYGNFIVTAPIELESKPFQTMYLVIENKNKAPLLQGELRTTINNDLAMAHINVTENNGLNAHITIYWGPQGGGCPIIVRKSV